jgi:rhodanese-related sulfurtransferase
MPALAQSTAASFSSELQPQPAPVSPDDIAILLAAAERAVRERLPYAGTLSPHEAWRVASAGAAVIIDVRTAEEYHFVGHVQDTALVPWQSGKPLTKNPKFIEQLAAIAATDATILFLCRSGKRSAAAAEAATKSGFTRVFNIREGFEGDISATAQRGAAGGWRYHGLPWIQD